jgi:hypothetical protein
VALEITMTNPEKRVVTIVGGGASAHVLIPFLSGAGHEVNVLTRKPDDWSTELTLQYQSIDGELIEEFPGALTRASADPADVIPEADVVILCMPVCTYRLALHNLAPHLARNKEVFVGTIYGQAGFNWMVDEINRRFELRNVVTFAAGLIPWICRIIEYGKVGVTYGPKAVNVAAVSSPERFDEFNQVFLRDICERWFDTGAFEQSDNFLSLTLSVDNQIIHPTRCYGLYQKYGGKWATKEKVPYFYRDYDELSANLLRDLDADYSKIRETIKDRHPDRDFRYMLDYLGLERLSYKSVNTDIRESMVTSQTLGAIKPPTVQIDSGEWVIDTNHRFFTDDITYGVCIAKWMAEQLNLDVPMIDSLIEWAQEIRHEKYFEGGKLLVDSESLTGEFKSGIPPVYGIHDIEGILG